MRVWAFPSFYPYNYPGFHNTGIFAHRQYKGLIENGAELKVIIPVPWNPVFPFSLLHPEWEKYRKIAFPRERVFEGIKVYYPRIANLKPSRFVKKSYQERYVDAIVDFFKQQQISLHPSTDIFYSQWLPSSAFVQLAAHKLGVKSAILSIGDDVALWPHSNPQNFKLFEQTLIQADLRFACSDFLGREANRIIGKDLPYSVIGWGVDYDLFKPVPVNEQKELKKEYHIPEDKIVILNIGTASVRKGWLELFDALAEVKKTTDGFLLIGVHTGTLEFDFAMEAGKRGLAEHFLDLGELPPQSLSKIYNLADIFCLPSHAEGMANVVIEAMSSGLAVITTTVGGHPEIIVSGKNGILVPPKEHTILAEKILELVNNKQLRTEMGSEAREFIVKKWGNFADNARLLYKKLCS